MFSNVRTYLRNIALVHEGLDADVCSTGFTVLRPTPAIESRFLFRYVLTDEFLNRVTPQQTGTHYPATSDRVVLGEVVPLPPIAEQKRIVAKVEELLTRVNATRERLARVPTILNRFRQAVLAAACSGQLSDTVDSDTSLPKSTLAEYGVKIHTGPFGTMLHKADYVEDGIPIINPTHIHDGHVIPDSRFTVSPRKAAELERYRLQEGDVLLGRRGEMGRAAIVEKEQERFLCGTGSMILRAPGDKLDPRFLCLSLRSPITVAALTEGSVGSTMINLNQGIVSNLTILKIPVSAQRRIVHQALALFTLAGKIETRTKTAVARVDKITQAILSRAFRGELVPTEAKLARAEGRPYEPASALLARVRSPQAAKPVVGKRTSCANGPRGRRSEVQ